MTGAVSHSGLYGRWRCTETIVTQPCTQFAVVVHDGEVLCESCGAPALGAARLLGLEHRTSLTDDELRVLRAAASPDEPPPQEPDGSDDYATCLALQRRGFLCSRDDTCDGRRTVVFEVTDMGREALAASDRI